MIAGLVITVGLYSQCIKVFRTKSARDFSALLIVALLYSEIAWLVYGLGIREWPITALALINLPAEVAITIGYIKYGRAGKVDGKQE